MLTRVAGRLTGDVAHPTANCQLKRWEVQRRAEAREGQALLRKHVVTITMLPKAEGPDRYYLATGAFAVSVLDRTSCGGAIINPTKTGLPFSVKISIGGRTE